MGEQDDTSHTSQRSADNSHDHVQLPSKARLHVSEERMWNAVAGHGPDLQRIPKPEFACLSIISSCRSQGILQADLVRLTGQDKRSLPKRTQNLHDHGYIEKRSVLFNGQRTSWLYGKRFAPGLTNLNARSLEAETIDTRPKHPEGSVVEYRAVFDGLFGILRDAKSHVITNSDLIKKMVCALYKTATSS